MPIETSIQGQKFGKLTAVQRVFKHPRIVHYLCRCDCGKETTVKKQHLQNGNTKSCGCNHLKRGSQHRDWKGYGEISADFLGIIRRNAEVRNIDFNLTIELLWSLFLKQERRCAYSNVELKFPSSGKVHDGTASLDRIDNEKGYLPNNVQWVHKDINLMKRALTEKNFLDFIEKIYDNCLREDRPNKH
jgi:hypothetical protein